jgi:hypothetical protein
VKNEMDGFEIMTLLSILRDKMKHKEDSDILQNAITDLIEINIPNFRVKYKIFLRE